MCHEQVVTLTLVGNIELIYNLATLDCDLDHILPVQSIQDDYHHLQAELLKNNSHTHHTKLKMKVHDDPVSNQKSGHLHRTLHEHCHLQGIHAQELMQFDLKARIHPAWTEVAKLVNLAHPSSHANSTTNAYNAFDTPL